MCSAHILPIVLCIFFLVKEILFLYISLVCMDNKTTCMQGQKKIIWVTNGNENTGSSSHSDLTTQNLKTCFDNLGQKIPTNSTYPHFCSHLISPFSAQWVLKCDLIQRYRLYSTSFCYIVFENIVWQYFFLYFFVVISTSQQHMKIY